MHSSLLLAHHSSPFISVISTANEHCTTGVQAFPPSHASPRLKVRFYLFAFHSSRAFLYSTTTSPPRAKPLRTCHLYQTEVMCALTRLMCVRNHLPCAALHSFLPERRKEKKRNQARHSPSSASPCQAVPVVHRAPSKAVGVGVGVPSPRCSGPPVAAFPQQGPGGAQGRCRGRAAAGARGAAPGDVTARRVRSQAPNGISYGALQLPGSLLTRNASSFYTEAEKWGKPAQRAKSLLKK